MRNGTLETVIAGERVGIHAERALWWPRDATLVIADVHVGKDHIFRQNGIPIPNRVSSDQLDRITSLLIEKDVQRLVVLGDFVHGSLKKASELLAELSAWRQRHASIQMDLIVGNHDRSAGDAILRDLFDLHEEALACGPFLFAHEPVETRDLYTLAGHLHPGFVVRESRRAARRLPAFWLRSRCAVLPAFGSFTGVARIEPREGDRIYVVADGEVAQI